MKVLKKFASIIIAVCLMIPVLSTVCICGGWRIDVF